VHTKGRYKKVDHTVYSTTRREFFYSTQKPIEIPFN
jgi:hypothetical protein